MPRRIVRPLALALGLLSPLAGCGGSGDGPLQPLDASQSRLSTRSDLEAARLRWHAAGIRDYDLDYRETGAWGPGERVRVSVRGGVVTDVTPLDGSATQPWQRDFYRRVAVDSLFARLDRAFDGQADDVRTTYDARLGVPSRAYIDFRTGWADDEVGWSVDAIRVVRR